jgi:hypothetical protein
MTFLSKIWFKGVGEERGAQASSRRRSSGRWRLECLLFMGYDPCFEGDEPPGL